MIFDWFKRLGGGKKRPRDNADRNAIIRRVVAAAAGEARQTDGPSADIPADTGPATATEEPPRKPGSGPVAVPRAADGPDIPPGKVAQRAYEIWVRKGRPFGTADQDWLQAEAELRAELLYRPDDALPNKPR